MNNYPEMRNELCDILKIASQHYATFEIASQFAKRQFRPDLCMGALGKPVLKFIKIIQHL